MRSFQNLLVLQNLYRLRALGCSYSDPILINPPSSDPLPSQFDQLCAMIGNCHLCDLSKSRTRSMSGGGNPNARLMILDAYVSTAVDESNHYYAGHSGATLKKMIENVLMLDVSDVFITHGVKCKPLGTQLPSESEIQSCQSYLFKQLELIKPQIIMPLGGEAYEMLTGDTTPFEQVRGRQIPFGAMSVIPIYHPSFLLRNPSLKKVAMQDLQTIKELL